MKANSQFSEKALDEIFKFNPEEPMRLISRESSWLEFKESFNYTALDEYAKTMASFANNQGGYLVFGIKDKPKDLIGLKDNTFQNLDPARLSTNLNARFSPEIKWSCHTETIKGKNIGFIYVFESSEKPVIAKSNGKDIKEGAIYYRYHGSSELIKYPELLATLNKEKNKERRQWFKLMTKINKLGIENIGLLDLKTGELTGTAGTYYINEDLIQEINFIKEGEFNEIDGTPTLKLIGNVQPINVINTDKEIFHKNISSLDLITTFLSETPINNPFEYLSSICGQPTANYPIYFYLKQLNQSINIIRTKIEEMKIRGQGKKLLLDRLSKDKIFFSKSTNHDVNNYFALIGRKDLPNSISNDKLDDFFQAILGLKVNSFDKNYLFPYLKRLYESKFLEPDIKSTTTTYMRKAACHLDQLLYSQDKTIGLKALSTAGKQ